ncbi:MAG: peptidogalycan biosysnthesis protein, partial [Beijerinckiaceae bacterium]
MRSALPLSVQVSSEIAVVSAAEWDACAVGEAPGRPNPFVSHDFLLSLEISGCVGGRTGWIPSHVLVKDADGALLAAAPCYLKMHSQGEYVFDHAFADALERAGGQYYPKLQVASPFSPVPGPRLLVRAGPRAEEARRALVQGLLALRRQSRASSVHVTFASEEDSRALAGAGFLERHDQQFHWQNDNYADFEAFLASLASRKRKAIRRERRDALANGISIELLTGDAIAAHHWDAFHRFYMDTGSRKW